MQFNINYLISKLTIFEALKFHIIKILIMNYNKITFWTLPLKSKRSRKHSCNLHHLLLHPSQSLKKTRLKSDLKLVFYFRFILNIILLTLNKVIWKKNRLFLIRFKAWFYRLDGDGKLIMKNLVKCPGSSWYILNSI